MPHPSLTGRLPTWLAALRPAPLTVDHRERWRAAFGGFIGILITGVLCRWADGAWLSGSALPWLVAPLGASAVLVFCVPGSPLAQPWSVVGGNTLSALVGIACAKLIPDPAWAGATAVGLAIALMFACRCLHPPGGAMALLTSLGHVTHFSFAAFPAFVDSSMLVLAGIAFNQLTGKRYPHAQQRAAAPAAGEPPPRFSAQDLDAALRRHNEVLDVSRDDLEALLRETEAQSYQRLLGDLRCEAVMTRDPLSVQFGDSLQTAWRLMREHKVKALPVVDRWHKLVGIVTLADFMKHADLDLHEGFAERLRGFVRRVTTVHADKPDVVGQIMTRHVRVASANRPVLDLAAVFSEGGHHHIPIIDERRHLVGILTQTDFVRALYRAVGGHATGTHVGS